MGKLRQMVPYFNNCDLQRTVTEPRHTAVGSDGVGRVCDEVTVVDCRSGGTW